MNKYEVAIYWSEEDECFISEVPELPGCMADGKSKTEALQKVEVVIAEWIETAQMLDRPIPEPGYIPILVGRNGNRAVH
ncbi:MAG: type II toxin-antitoxin system HicB family antitoxin [Oscillospiraceae bacterium]|nr:type II toxin-antitoxin system HicB family antitoxin [Oscillospiraceae bacterium]